MSHEVKATIKALVEIDNPSPKGTLKWLWFDGPWFDLISKLSSDNDNIIVTSFKSAIDYIESKGTCKRVFVYMDQITEFDDEEIKYNMEHACALMDGFTTKTFSTGTLLFESPDVFVLAYSEPNNYNTLSRHKWNVVNCLV